MENLKNFLENIIIKMNRLENLPSGEDLKKEKEILLENIKNLNIKDPSNMEKVVEYFQRLIKIDEMVILRMRIDSGISTLIYFLYTLSGSIAGLILSIFIFLTTTGFVGHILILLSMTGSIISIAIGINALKKERKYTLFLAKDLTLSDTDSSKN